MLWMYQRVFFGKVTHPENENLADLNFREKFVLVPLVIMIFWIGFYPKPFLTLMEPAVKAIIQQVEQGRTAADAILFIPSAQPSTESKDASGGDK